jgi:hypothetical protein
LATTTTRPRFVKAMSDLLSECLQHKYLVIESDNPPVLYTSLRNIQQDLHIDYSTISKRLKEQPYCEIQKDQDSYVIVLLPWAQ